MNNRITRTRTLCALLPAVLTAGVPSQEPPGAIPSEVAPALERIRADSLRGHLSFIASDLLAGRDTPSQGLTIASEYIAAQFRRAGLEPAGNDGYFQTATMSVEAPEPEDFACTVHFGNESITVPADRISIMGVSEPLDIRGASLVMTSFDSDEPTDRADQDGPIVAVTSMPSPQSVPREQMREFFGQFNAFLERLDGLGASAVINLDAQSETGAGLDRQRGFGRRGAGAAIFTIHGADLVDRILVFADEATIDLRYDLPVQKDVTVRNVCGLLRGGDPNLADEYILVTAHYDHIGIGSPVDGDTIYNGANDDGSGTVSVMEIAAALASLETRPKRSILFIALYGEERGLRGSRYYVENPLVPLKDTIANLNLEHMGRTDDSEGPSIRRVMPTGYDFTTIGETLAAAGRATRIDVYHHPRNSDSFFGRSDNAAFANAGIPAHTICTAFIFPDYHGAGDHWDKIDYDNMAAADRMVTLALWNLANADERPTWNADHRRTGRYLEAWRELHGE